MNEKKLFLIDAFAIIYRSYFAFSKNPRITSTGMNTSAIYGFVNTLLEILEKQKPSHIAVVFDSEGPTERHETFTEYKAHREETPEDITHSIPYIKKILEGFHIPVITYVGQEADDLMASLAKKAENEGFLVYLMTPDKDLGQVVSDHIYLYKPARADKEAEIWGIKEICQRYNIASPQQVADILALAGDNVDNIPGVPGIGEKTAIKLIGQYHSVENLLNHLHEIKGKIGETLQQYKEQALLSKQLATVKTNLPLEISLDQLAISPPDKEKLLPIFKELEFRSISKRLFQEEIIIGSSPSPSSSSQLSLFPTENSQSSLSPTTHAFSTVEKNYSVIEDPETLQQWVKKIKKKGLFCFDTETSSLDDLNTQLIGLSLCMNPHEAAFCFWPQNKTIEAQYRNILNTIFQDPSLLKIGHNLKFDINVLSLYQIQVVPPAFDTMIAHYLMEPEMRHNMDYLSEVYLHYKPISIEQLIGKKGPHQQSMKNVPKELLVNYACEDADVTYQLYEIFVQKVADPPLHTLFYQLEMPIMFVLANMEQNGVKINSQWLHHYSNELNKRILSLEKSIYKQAGQSFNIDSPRQLGEILFTKLLPGEKVKKTKTGQYATSEEILLKIKDKHPIIPLLLEYRMLKKLKSTYVDALPTYVNPRTGRIHTSFMQAVTATGRLSSNNPNLQNIPIKTEEGRQLRAVFVPENPEDYILSADYSQIELRIIASLSNEENMITDFKEGKDIHAATAARIFNVPENSVTREMRSKAKAVNFGIIYGQSAFGLAESLNISKTEAKEIITQYFQKYPGIKRYMEDIILFAQKNGYVETLLGRRRYLRDIHSANSIVRGFAERNAINSPIQGSAADIIKIAMKNIHHAMQQHSLRSKMILQVHDELVFEVAASELNIMQKLVKKEMENAIQIKVPLVVEIGLGKNWLEAH